MNTKLNWIVKIENCEGFEHILVDLIKKALLGELPFEELHRAIPNPDVLPKTFKPIWDNLEEAVEHFPASFFTGKPLHYEFRQTDTYSNLVSNLKMLERFLADKKMK